MSHVPQGPLGRPSVSCVPSVPQCPQVSLSPLTSQCPHVPSVPSSALSVSSALKVSPSASECPLSVATGGFVGGALFFTVGGGRTFLYTGIFNILFTVLHVSLHLLLHTCWPSDAASGPGSPGGYVAPSESMRPVAATEEDLEDGM
ncbi:hypothetical protein O3P69_019371 [Scylla paramamosain]|uniref:Transmembrane protein n=1 Tax=Scylla paramamosain TaxID=85552 RepID=A0AAW0SVH1_SCYPA